jgi:hypothetical protein
MTTWVLILYLSTRITSNTATGGPTTIDGFTSLQRCEAANQQAARILKKYDWGQCLQVSK